MWLKMVNVKCRMYFNTLFIIIHYYLYIYLFIFINKELFKTTDDFLKLEKIIFGGIKGRQLTAKIEKMFEDFSITYNYFTGIPYDPLDPEEEHFNKDYAKFKKQIAHYDNSLASILTLAYEECFTTESIFKVYIDKLHTLKDALSSKQGYQISKSDAGTRRFQKIQPIRDFGV